MKVAAILFSVGLAGCATVPVEPRPDHLFHDHLFAGPSQRISAHDVFAVNAEMRRYLNGEIADQLRAKGRQRGLFDALYSGSQLKLEYDAAMTRNASQAFAARSGNCLSLVIMTAAFAKELGLEVGYQRVFGEETWSRSGDIYVSSGHINVILGRKSGHRHVLFSERNLLIIDFLPQAGVPARHASDTKEETVVAMYMNNRAAELLARGRLDDAYWFAREAVELDAKFMAAYNTLGVIYRHQRHLKEAQSVFEHVLDREPGNLHVLSNLALVFNDQGRVAESQALTRKLEQLQPYPPFHFFNRGVAAMREGDYQAARDLFAREVDRDAYNHEFHFWLAAAHLSLGETAQARAHLTIAMENGTTPDMRDLYAAKLDRIRAARSP